MRSRSLVAIAFAAAGFVSLLTALPANAVSVSIKVSGGAAPDQIVTDNVAAGWASFIGTQGTFNINQISGQAGNNVVAPDVLTTNSLNTSTTAGGVLDIFITAQDLSSLAVATAWLSTFAVNNLSSTVTLSMKTFLDTANGLFSSVAGGTVTELGTAGPFIGILPPTEGDVTNATPDNQFSLTAWYHIESRGEGTSNASVQVRVVPGPIVGAGIPGLLMACFALVALARRRRQSVMA